MMQQGMTPGDPARVFEGRRVQLHSGDRRELFNNDAPRFFYQAQFDISELEERFLVIARANFEGCEIRTRPGQALLFVDRLGHDQPMISSNVRIVGGGQAMPRVLFSVLKCAATEGDRRIETTQTIDFSTLAAERVFVRNLIAVGDLVIGKGQSLVIDPASCILLGDVVLSEGSRIETPDCSSLNWHSLRLRDTTGHDFERQLVFNQRWERPPVVVVPRGLDFRDGYPSEITLSDAVIGGDIHLRPGQTLIIGVSEQKRRSSVLLRGSVLCSGESPQIIGDRGFHALNRSMPSLAPISMGRRAGSFG